MSKVPDRFKELENVQVYASDDQVVITGIPDEDDESHNCDVMGCSSVSHVLYRFAVLPPWQKVIR
ncbi:hypothetical protein [Paenibacillus sp.]|uniref:hypothetical protein n=1 Tax=Paenibacillus sp. TaxID=58172 RepID=UPI002D407D19|nr:hypothetical protein [Paenibacillus sp.]HZG83856.1 hypothetical protein [Paenibacillus sp.]